ncbi:DUF1015 domain-containing protein [Candidatus Caldatribacterium sp.]|uniref:DUF1015 domain-containing protein n=1 Tax=Candidatus Caldatribacterium sp. TaxID=2282143 RepID=UPI0029949EE1|nr:DUF1015 domain-containing protein [Candidatus Caldatribacterium sp.]MDW8081224.1 DUF1015 domain-containing protein [Candidatus Calescibacterium sp.]
MAVIKPFLGYRYAEEYVQKRGIGKLVAPPYDVVSEKEKQRLAEEEYNFVHLILGKDASGYENAALRLRRWIEKGVFTRDSLPSLYIYEQEFALNSFGRRKRTGFVALVRLEEFAKRIIFPHERTMPKYSLDRLELLRATRANLEQIFCLYNDPQRVVDALLEEYKRPEAELFAFTDHYGVVHRLFRLSDGEAIAYIRKVLNPRTLIIADGHHRYETCLMYRRERREALGDPLGEIPEDYAMMFLVNIHNPGLLILPTHRLVHSLPEGRLMDFFKKCEVYFEVRFFQNERAMEEFLQSAPPFTIGVYERKNERWGTITLKDPRIMDERLGEEDVNRHLDTTILHELVFREILGLNREGEGESEFVDYLRGTKDVFAIAKEENKYQLVFVMRPTPIEHVERAVAKFQRMPQKSTYFYPKAWSGLVFRMLEE